MYLEGKLIPSISLVSCNGLEAASINGLTYTLESQPIRKSADFLTIDPILVLVIRCLQ